MNPQTFRVGIDIGGTFTDFVLADPLGRVAFGKALTDHRDLSQAMLAGIEQLLGDRRAALVDLAGIVHATTLVANAVIERKGATVGLLTTRGFRDTLEIGRETRYDVYDLFLEKPQPLVPRRLRCEVSERVDATGNILEAMSDEDVRTAAHIFRQAQVGAVAICFLHSYLNPAHERQARALLRAELPDMPITLSSDIAPEIREYERANTACANAYVHPLVERYLAELEGRLGQRGWRGTLHLMLSGGGFAAARTARTRPIHLIESGPAAGAIAASRIGSLAGTRDLVSFDMGGTTAKICLLRDGRPQRSNEFEAARVRRFRKGSGLPLKVPVIDLIEIGAGGGSLARVDAMGLLQVGPDSAGSEPGPIAYGRGGLAPTVTDADLVLGYLSPDYFLGGTMTLDVRLVRHGIEEHLARPLGLTTEQAAAGIHAVASETMAAAARMHLAENGVDPRQIPLLAFGGAGPVHAYGLAKLLKMPRVIVPPGAGVLSAFGLLVAPPAADLAGSYVARLHSIDWATVNRIYAELEAQARELLIEAGARSEDMAITRTADMRYVGQGYEIAVSVPKGSLGPECHDALRERFLATYERLFDRRIEGIEAEALVWRVHATAPTQMSRVFLEGRCDEGEPRKGSRKVFFPQTGYDACPVYERGRLRPGMRFAGPAIVEERETTTVIGPDADFRIDEHLNLIIDIRVAQGGTINDGLAATSLAATSLAAD
jgi:N-methylhydantoinase A